jgi:hypothetical protein
MVLVGAATVSRLVRPGVLWQIGGQLGCWLLLVASAAVLAFGRAVGDRALDVRHAGLR